MDPDLRRGDAVVWLGSNFCVYCATVNRSNFKDPIPACAGMTRTVYLFLFYEHCSGLCYSLFLSRHPGVGRGPLPRRDRSTTPPPCGHPDPGPAELLNSVGGSLAKGNLIESTSCHCERSAAIHETTPRPAGTPLARGELGPRQKKTSAPPAHQTLSLNHFITCPLSLLSVQNRCIMVNSMAVLLNSRCHMLESRRV